jgi:vesicle coat complex subunit
MAYYDLSKPQKEALYLQMKSNVEEALTRNSCPELIAYSSDEDTYIRKNTYLILGRAWHSIPAFRNAVLSCIAILSQHPNPHVRQTAINAAGEIGKTSFESVAHFFDQGLFDQHHVLRNAVIGSIKKMGEVNPEPVLLWARKYLHHTDKEIRREICHGIELRGRKHPLDILALLKELQWDKTSRVSKTLVHVIGQIAYKKGCLEQVAKELCCWENEKLVESALAEIVAVHERYIDFSYYTQPQALSILLQFFPNAASLKKLAGILK